MHALTKFLNSFNKERSIHNKSFYRGMHMIIPHLIVLSLIALALTAASKFANKGLVNYSRDRRTPLAIATSIGRPVSSLMLDMVAAIKCATPSGMTIFSVAAFL